MYNCQLIHINIIIFNQFLSLYCITTMKFVVALLLAQCSAINLRQMNELQIQNEVEGPLPYLKKAQEAKEMKTPKLIPYDPTKPPLTDKQRAFLKAQQAIEEKMLDPSAEQDAKDKKQRLIDLYGEHARDMDSEGAIWAGDGTPPPLTHGDTTTMAAPRPGFSPIHNPGSPQ